MKDYCCIIGFLIFFLSPYAQAAEFSTSVLKPTPLGSEGSIESTFPEGGEKVTYYFSAAVQKGALLTQIFFKGQAGREKRVELALLDANANLISAYWIQGADAQRDALRSFPIEEPGSQLLRITVSGPETDEFRLEFGGSALLQSSPPSATVSAPSIASQTNQ